MTMTKKMPWGAVSAVAITLAGTGIAAAYFSTQGGAAGSASTGTMTITGEVLTGETPDSVLYPGGTADVLLKLHNPNAYPVRLITITAVDAPAAANGCSPTGVTFTPPPLPDPRFRLAADATTVLHIDGGMAMDTTSASTCQGQTFTLRVTVTVNR
jgi:hypothetical protein